MSLADLADEPLIMFDVPSARNAAQMLERAGITPNVRHFTSNIEVVRSLVARGVGYSILVQRWPIDLSYEGRPLVSLDSIVGAPERTVVLAWAQGRDRPACCCPGRLLSRSVRDKPVSGGPDRAGQFGCTGRAVRQRTVHAAPVDGGLGAGPWASDL